jgi:hypothetical protein
MEDDMAKSAAERQADFKARMYARGFKQKQIWVDEDGFMVGPEDVEGGGRPKVTYAKFLRELKTLINPMTDDEKEEIYAELLVYARALRQRWDYR